MSRIKLLLMIMCMCLLSVGACSNSNDDIEVYMYIYEDDAISYEIIEPGHIYDIVHNSDMSKQAGNWEINIRCPGYALAYISDDQGQISYGDNITYLGGNITIISNHLSLGNYYLIEQEGNFAFTIFQLDGAGEYVVSSEPSYIYIYVYDESPAENHDINPITIYGIRLIRSEDIENNKMTLTAEISRLE